MPGTSPPVTEMLRRNWSNQLTTGVLPMKWSMPRQAMVPPGRTHACAVAIDSGPEMVSTTTWAPSPAGVLHHGLLDLLVVARRHRQGGPQDASPWRGGRRGGRGRSMRSAPLAVAPCTRGEAHGAVADHDDRLARRRRRPTVSPCQPGGHHVHQRQQARLAVGARQRLGHRQEGGVGEGDAHVARTGRPAPSRRAARCGAPSRTATSARRRTASPSRHQVHSPQATEHDDITRSPTAKPRTSGADGLDGADELVAQARARRGSRTPRPR